MTPTEMVSIAEELEMWYGPDRRWANAANLADPNNPVSFAPFTFGACREALREYINDGNATSPSPPVIHKLARAASSRRMADGTDPSVRVDCSSDGHRWAMPTPLDVEWAADDPDRFGWAGVDECVVCRATRIHAGVNR